MRVKNVNYSKCFKCGRLNKANHNVICAIKPNKRRLEYDRKMEAARAATTTEVK